MKAFIEFIKSSVMGGFFVLLPICLIAYLVFEGVEMFMAFSDAMTEAIGLDGPLYHALILAAGVLIIVCICFVVGMLIRTRAGGYSVGLLDKLLTKVPMFTLIKRIVDQTSGAGAENFAPVLFSLSAGEMSVFGLFIERSGEDMAVVFVPSSPAPGVGHVVQVPYENMQFLDASLISSMDGLMNWGNGLGKAFATVKDKEKLANGNGLV
ncbi:DUF502 domain-containing protein [Maridesulfovibrio frigidus]|uniref:DUF502 domain-containing protein n=1 Tax=Maridesulfovibrio frigidus TaxID=340956 RepID=UPI0004E1C140|nr:DUF502 domain-containing protein [Maridesulfovibrio frigidus]